MRLNGNGALTFEDARTWIEETGLCLFLPRRQFSTSVAPSFVEAIAGHRNSNPDPKHSALAEELLVRLETDGVAVRLNLLGQPGEHPDFVVAAWVLPYVYALRGDRDWRRNPQLTGSRQVSQLAVQAYKLLEAGETTIPSLKHTLGREVTEQAVLRAITELWQQLRIIRPDRGDRCCSRGDCRRRIDIAGDCYFGARFHLPASRNCGHDGRCGTVPCAADRAQQSARSAARLACNAAGAHHFTRPCSAFLCSRHIARVRRCTDHLRQLVHAGVGLFPSLARS